MSSTLSIACTITRPSVPGGPLADLNLNDNTNYKMIGIGPGSVEWNRQYASSPYLHGEVLVNAVKSQGNLPMSVRVKGGTHSLVNSNLAALLRALEQFLYRITITIEGVTWTWECDPADYSVDESGGEFNKFYKIAKQTVVTAQIPRNPTPIAGSL